MTLEPSRVIDILSLARQHDEMLKEARQDLFRAETKLSVRRKWQWPIRLACVGLGAGGYAVAQSGSFRTQAAEALTKAVRDFQAAGAATLVMLVAAGLALYLVAWLVTRSLRKPSPERQARKLMEQFARADGVAAYVFAEDSPEHEAASIGALTRPENKNIRQRHLNVTNRSLHSSMNRLLNRMDDDPQALLH